MGSSFNLLQIDSPGNNSSLVIANNVITNNLVDAVRSGSTNVHRYKIARGRHVQLQVTNGFSEEFSEFDIAVLSCLHGIWQDASNPDNTFSLTLLCRMLGYTHHGGLSVRAREEVHTSLNRLAAVTCRIRPEDDFEPHRNDFFADHPDLFPSADWDMAAGICWGADNPLIAFDQEEHQIQRSGPKGSKTEITFRLTSEPLLHLYSRITGQFVTISSDRFQIHAADADGQLLANTLPMTKTRIAIAFWTARQIERMRYAAAHSSHTKKKDKPTSKNSVLRLSTIFDRAGINKRNASKHKGRNIEFLTQLLSSWNARGLIPGEWSLRPSLFGSFDGIVFDFIDQQKPETKLDYASAVPKDTGYDTSTAPDNDTTNGAIDTILGAIDTILGAIASGVTFLEKTAESHFTQAAAELSECLKYVKYSNSCRPQYAKLVGDGCCNKDIPT